MARLVGRTRMNHLWLLIAVAGALLVLLLLALWLLTGQTAPGVSGSMGV